MGKNCRNFADVGLLGAPPFPSLHLMLPAPLWCDPLTPQPAGTGQEVPGASGKLCSQELLGHSARDHKPLLTNPIWVPGSVGISVQHSLESDQSHLLELKMEIKTLCSHQCPKDPRPQGRFRSINSGTRLVLFERLKQEYWRDRKLNVELDQQIRRNRVFLPRSYCHTTVPVLTAVTCIAITTIKSLLL